jgi:hypothetical protein
VSQTGDYTVVQLKRQDELTRAIQGRVAKARDKQIEEAEKKDSAKADAA